MADLGSNTAITVALIAVVGTLGAAYINASAGRHETAPVMAPVTATQTAATPTAPMSAASGAAVASAAAAPIAAAAAADASPDAAKSAKLDLTGTWSETNTGALYTVAQSGDAISVKGRFGSLAVDASGSAIGNAIKWTFTTSLGDYGKCNGQIVTSERMDVDCVNTNGAYSIVLQKVAG